MIHIPQAVARIPIVRGIFRLGLMAYAGLFKNRFVIEQRMGLQLLLDRDNTIDWQLFIAGKWERPQFNELFGLAAEQLRRRRADAIFLDIGAHWGLYALAARQSGMFSRILAFEPDPINYGQLQANLFLNHAQDAIEPIQLAASDCARDFAIEPGNVRNRGATKMIEPDSSHPTAAHGIAIDSRYPFTDKLLVIKIDVESHEPEVLDGMRNLLSRNRCILQVELWDEPDGESERRFKLLSALFAGYNMRFVRAIDSDFFFVSDFPHAQTLKETQ
jgi:FkbM family methyltransferase